MPRLLLAPPGMRGSAPGGSQKPALSVELGYEGESEAPPIGVAKGHVQLRGQGETPEALAASGDLPGRLPVHTEVHQFPMAGPGPLPLLQRVAAQPLVHAGDPFLQREAAAPERLREESARAELEKTEFCMAPDPGRCRPQELPILIDDLRDVRCPSAASAHDSVLALVLDTVVANLSRRTRPPVSSRPRACARQHRRVLHHSAGNSRICGQCIRRRRRDCTSYAGTRWRARRDCGWPRQTSHPRPRVGTRPSECAHSTNIVRRTHLAARLRLRRRGDRPISVQP